MLKTWRTGCNGHGLTPRRLARWVFPPGLNSKPNIVPNAISACSRQSTRAFFLVQAILGFPMSTRLSISDRSLNDPMIFSIPRLVAEHAASSPDSLALVAGAESLAYAELDRRSNQLAEHLRSLGAGHDVLIGILLERSIASVISTLAVLKVGAAYLPLDPALPSDRLAFMLRDSGVATVITREGLSGKMTAGSWNVVNLDADRNCIAGYYGRTFDTEADSSHLAYVIYTSGSTGQPKGVEITRGSLQNLIEWHLRAFQVTSADRASLMASMSFDAAVSELWPYLSAAASVHIPPDSLRT